MIDIDIESARGKYIPTGPFLTDRVLRVLGVGTADIARGPKLALERLLRGNGMPESPLCEALVVWLEVVKNWHRHTRSPELVWRASITSRRAHLHEAMRSGSLTIQASYGTRRFATHAREPDLYRGSGWGIGLIRGLCDETSWRFEASGDSLRHDVRHEVRHDAGDLGEPAVLRLTLIKRWFADENR
jgi:hypothetical protein